MSMEELEEWRARPTRENRLALGAVLAIAPRPFADETAEVALEWALGLPVAGGSAAWDRDPENLALAFAIRGGHATRRGLAWFAAEAFDTAQRIGRGRAVDRSLRVLLAESTNDTDPCFWAAIAIAFRLPKYAKFHGFPRRVQRPIAREPSRAELLEGLEDDLREITADLTDELLDSEEDRAFIEAARVRVVEQIEAAKLAPETSEAKLAVTEYLVDERDDLREWTDLDELFVPCASCQKAAAAPLCDGCVKRRAEVQARNAEGQKALEEPAREEDVFRRFPEVLNELATAEGPTTAGPSSVEVLLWAKLREFRAEGGDEGESESHRALTGPDRS